MSDPFLTVGEKRNLGRQRSAAFAYQDKLGLIENEGENKTQRQKIWARRELKEHFGIESLTQARRSQFRSIKAHFQELAGEFGEAIKNQLKTGPVNDNGDPNDTHEQRELWHAKIKKALAEHQALCCKPGDEGLAAARRGGSIGMGYIIAIARNRFHKPAGWSDLTTLKADQLRQLFFTTEHNIAKREGRQTAKQ